MKFDVALSATFYFLVNLLHGSTNIDDALFGDAICRI